MAEFEAGGTRYRTRSLCVFDQWQLLFRLRPILPALHGMDHSLRCNHGEISDITKALAPLLRAKDDDMRSVFRLLIGACEQSVEEAWTGIGKMPPLVVLMTIAAVVVSENFGALFAMERVKFDPIGYSGPVYKPVSMPNVEDWLFRPVLRGLCKLESLYDGTLRIEQIAKANDALDVEEENQARMRKELERAKPKR